MKPANHTVADAVRHLTDALRAADIVMMIACGIIGYHLRHPDRPLSEMYLVTLVCGVLMFAIIANACDLYNPTRLQRFKRQVVPLAFTHALSMLGLIALLFFAHVAGEFSRIWMGIWFLGACICMVVMRLLLMRWMRRKLKAGAFARRIVLVGGIEKTQQVITALRNARGTLQVAAVCITDAPLQQDFFDSSPTAPQIPIIPSVVHLAEYCRITQTDEVIITSDLEAHPNAATILASLESLPCSVRYVIPGHFFGRPLVDAGLLIRSTVTAMPVVTIFRAPLTSREQLLKRASDITFATIALTLASPIMAIIALLIARDGQGNILFRQKRHGFAGNEFSIYKFRSMHVSSEADVKQATRNDARVTKIGAIIRRLSLDELPQLFNVLKGDMSLVGPRPHALSHNAYYENLVASYAMRHRIKPGITGFAQVNGWRGETDTIEKMQKRVENDLYYIEHWSLWLDLKILVLTVFSVLRPKNAY